MNTDTQPEPMSPVARVLQQLAAGSPLDKKTDAPVLPATSRQKLVALLEALALDAHADALGCSQLYDNLDDNGGAEAVDKLIAELKADGDEVLQLQDVNDRLIRELALLQYTVRQAMTGRPPGRPSKSGGKGKGSIKRQAWDDGVRAVRKYLGEMSAPCNSGDELADYLASNEIALSEYVATADLLDEVVPGEHLGSLDVAVSWLLGERDGYALLRGANERESAARREMAGLSKALAEADSLADSRDEDLADQLLIRAEVFNLAGLIFPDVDRDLGMIHWVSQLVERVKVEEPEGWNANPETSSFEIRRRLDLLKRVIAKARARFGRDSIRNMKQGLLLDALDAGRESTEHEFAPRPNDRDDAEVLGHLAEIRALLEKD